MSLIDEWFQTTQTLPSPLRPGLAYRVRSRVERDQVPGRSCSHGRTAPYIAAAVTFRD